MSRGIRRVGVLVTAAWAGVAHAQPAAPEPSVEYVVKPDDTCLGIAIRILGDRNAVADIHRLNSGLGALPHILKPGKLLRLPRKKDGADARLTGTSGDVRVRRPTDSAWDAAKRGMDLFRSWRVAAGERASAEVTFSDTKHLYLREHTIVVIYGPQLGRARVTVNEATLESGTLRTRLSELSGGGDVKVTTPTAVAGVSGGSALISVADDGASTIANHQGKPVDLRGRGKGAGRVAVASGWGSRVKKGARPEKPRKLPAPPAWVTGADVATAFPSVGGAGASMSAAWSPVAGASAYRVEVDAPSDVTVFSAEVPATVTHVEVHGAPPGRYRARVATVDADRFEGRPAPDLALTVVAIAVTAPGTPAAATPAAATPAAPTTVPADHGDLPLSSTAPSAAAAPVLAQGSTLGDRTLTCTSGSDSGAPLDLRKLGRATVACTTADDQTVAPFAVEVVAVTASATTGAAGAAPVAVTRGDHREITIRLDSAVPLGNGWRIEPGPGLTCEGFEPADAGVTIRVGIDEQAPSTSTLEVLDDRTGNRIATVPVTIGDRPVTASVTASGTASGTAPVIPSVRSSSKGAFIARRTHVAAGAFAGWTSFPSGMTDGLELGDAPVSAFQIDSGAGGGMRAAVWLQPELFVELEAGLWPTGFVAAEEPAWITSGHALVGYQFVDRERFAGRAVVGAGGYALLGDATYARADADPDLTWGLTGALRLDRELSLRVDGRHRIAPDRADAGVTDVFELTVGIEAVVTRIPASR
ncbi:MAG TPA: LysM domain-containing protein [Kofleriaceae bacterium]|nr:LysM domain-containing protein [Kofleriaceae bacterium]